ncbi:uncharacterized protein LOC143355533 [Halictus rubicundus]|uniref:uncharacterized protein LOC143355533 n=1 Tax=Halictus rubicundus TaxID=77578 RepID=UPI004036FA83
MAVQIVGRRFKSTSNILDEVRSDKMVGRTRNVPEDRYRTYTFNDLQQEKRKFAKKHEPKKSQNLLKKLLASLEKKNEACKADDEFFAEYYRRNDYSNPNSDCLGERLQNIGETSENCQFSKKTFFVSRCRPGLDSKKLPVVENRENKEFLPEDLTIDDKVEKLLQRHSVDFANSRRFRRTTDDLNRCTLEKIFTECKQEIGVKDSRKKHDRKRSFKDFLGSMMKWKKSGRKQKPRRYASFDHLVDNTEIFYKENVKQLSRASSLNAVVLEDCEEGNVLQIKTRKATIHPIYGGKRNEQLLEVLARNKENQRIFAMNGSVENLVKPSAIKNIAKRLSQPPDNSRNDGRITTRWK